MQATYLTPERISSLKQYLDDVSNGIDTVTAWKSHKQRMATDNAQEAMTIEEAREIKSRPRPQPLTDSEWKELLAAERILAANNELEYAFYNED
jgi:hypothetical protein